MNLGSMIRNAAGRVSGRNGTGGTVRGRGMNTAGRARNASGAMGARPGGGVANRIMGMFRRH
ncbi:hypothetical protein FBY31_0847 [Arthrobacter sp. SLBN-100]|uniref:hypothetical protein n=1 Tax=Arthrobacter sp. SLBN-100 TaxID=2768450 RepID=UPI00114DD17A|nr:hypothetical protein [Arthrobacter sp. SLBN-100]TQJ66807.1 hypothetical protein FBY31_0847 [Arthrobacter sp. SLBN-100]